MAHLGLREDQISFLSTEVFNATSIDLQTEEELDQIDQSVEAATRLIEMAGFDLSDSDHFGAEMGSVVHNLLATAMMRCPQLARRILCEDQDVQIVTEEYYLANYPRARDED